MNSLNSPIKTGSVSNLVMGRIKDALLNGEIKPGDRLPSETELSVNLGVGKSSIREAIKMLAVMGVVETKQGEGTFVREHPIADSINPLVFQMILEQGANKEILELRAMFEPAYSIMAMNKAAPEDINAIQQTIVNLNEKIKQGAQTAEDDLAFHIAILYSTHNNFVIRIGETVLQLFKASIKKSMIRIPEIALSDHRKIFTAFCEKNTEKLYKAIVESFDGWIENL